MVFSVFHSILNSGIFPGVDLEAILEDLPVKIHECAARSAHLLWHYTVLTLAGHSVYLEEKQLIGEPLQDKIHTYYATAIEVTVYIHRL